MSAHSRPIAGYGYLAVPAVLLMGLAAVGLSGINIAVFEYLNRGLRVLGDTPWASITVLGEGIVVFPLMIVVHHRWPLAGWAVMLGGIVTALAVFTLKSGIGALRPPAMLGAEHVHIIGPTLLYRAFPSGHTATAALVAGVIILYSRHRGLHLFVALVAAGVGLSRIAVGAHWPTDVLGGFTVGWAGAWAGAWWANRWRGAQSVAAQRVLVGVFMTCAAGLFFYDSRYPATAYLQWLIGVYALAAGVFAWRRIGVTIPAQPHG